MRRAQALAHHDGIAVAIARELIGRKLAQQARIAGDHFGNQSIAEMIAAAKERFSNPSAPAGTPQTLWPDFARRFFA